MLHKVADGSRRLRHGHLWLWEGLSHKHLLSSACDAHHKHEDSVEEECHGTEGLDGGHHVSLQAERKHDEQGHREEQEYTESPGHLEGNQESSCSEP